MWNILKWLLVVFLNAYIIYKLIGKPMANIFSLYFVLKITRIHLVISADMNREHYSVYDFFFVVEKKSIEIVSYCNAHEESPAFPFICNAIVFVLNFLWVYGYGNIIFFRALEKMNRLIRVWLFLNTNLEKLIPDMVSQIVIDCKLSCPRI